MTQSDWLRMQIFRSEGSCQFRSSIWKAADRSTRLTGVGSRRLPKVLKPGMKPPLLVDAHPWLRLRPRSELFRGPSRQRQAGEKDDVGNHRIHGRSFSAID